MKWSRFYTGRETKPTGAVMRRVLNAIDLGREVETGGHAVRRLMRLGFVDVDRLGELWITPRGRVALAEEWTREPV